jgi:ABC-2 type transport system permease protein
MSSVTYIRYELLRTFRNRRFLIFSFGFPLILYFLIAGPNRHEHSLGSTGISAPLYYMVGLAAFGSMNAMLSTGARIASERQVGWNRQLRTTPLSTRTYFRAKVLTAYLVAVASLLLLALAGTVLGVRLPAHEWGRMGWLMLVGLVPFAVMGIAIGHLVAADSIGPVIGGSTALLAFLGGTWFPITGNGTLHDIAQALPSYWLVQAGHVALGGSGWSERGWIVVAAWTAVMLVVAARAYRRDTRRN